MSVFQTPWKLVGRSGNDFEQIKDADGNVLIEEIGFDLGMLIVKSVNHNNLLVDALVKVQEYGLNDGPPYNATEINDLIDAALAKATGVK